MLSEEHFGGRDAAGGVGEPEELSEEGQGPPPEDPGNPTVDFHKEKRTNETHQSTTDPDARLARKGKGKEAKLSYAGHVLMENRNGLVVNVRLTQATGTAEREAAVEMVDDIPGPKQVTVGADKNYDAEAMVQQLRERKATPHVAQNQERRRSEYGAGGSGPSPHHSGRAERQGQAGSRPRAPPNRHALGSPRTGRPRTEREDPVLALVPSC